MLKYFIILIVALNFVNCKNQQSDKNDVTKTITVSSRLIDCVGVVPQKCFLIKEEGQSDWENFYDTIEDFTYIEGFEYVLKVKEIEVQNPPADGSLIRVVLVKEISKVKKS